MRFVTLFAIMGYPHGKYTCPCNGGGSWYCHQGCGDKMPYNWVMPHDTQWIASQIKQKRIIDRDNLTHLPPKPVQFKRSDDYWDDYEAWGFQPQWGGMI